MIIDAIEFHEDSFQSDSDWKGLATVFASIYAWGVEKGHISDREIRSSYYTLQMEKSQSLPSDWVDQKCDYQISDIYFASHVRKRIADHIISGALYERIMIDLKLSRIYDVHDSWSVVTALIILIDEDMTRRAT